MAAYSFSRLEFVAKILDGSKPHTIRPERKRETKPGELLTLYYKQRTPEHRVICLTVCKAVRPVTIYPVYELINVEGHMLPHGKATRLAKRDGFNSAADMFAWFRMYKERTLFFELIEWDPKRLLNLWDVQFFQDALKGMSAEERLAWLDASCEIGQALEVCDGCN